MGRKCEKARPLPWESGGFHLCGRAETVVKQWWTHANTHNPVLVGQPMVCEEGMPPSSWGPPVHHPDRGSLPVSKGVEGNKRTADQTKVILDHPFQNLSLPGHTVCIGGGTVGSADPIFKTGRKRSINPDALAQQFHQSSAHPLSQTEHGVHVHPQHPTYHTPIHTLKP